MAKVQVFNIDKDRSSIIHKLIGVILIIVGIFLLLEYLVHFLKITVAIFLLLGGIFFLVKESRFRWFRFRQF